MIDKIRFPSNITFQWHITDQCNLRCLHCYQASYTEKGLPFDQKLEILNKLERFVEAARQKNGKIKAHINFTGGEPFLQEDFIYLLKRTHDLGIFSIGILSNGYLLPVNELDILQKIGISYIQLSVEGDRKINEQIRGKGSLNQVENALAVYRKLKIPTVLSFTANAKNYTSFPAVAKFARKNKVNKLWTDRYLPSSSQDPLKLNAEQTQEYFKILAKEQKRNKLRFTKTVISAHRALQFLVSGGVAYHCTAGKSLLAIMPTGELYPCRRLPIPIGNILDDELLDVYANNKTLIELRKVDENQDEACASCYYKTSCQGGLKCLSYIEKENFHAKDPGCWF